MSDPAALDDLDEKQLDQFGCTECRVGLHEFHDGGCGCPRCWDGWPEEKARQLAAALPATMTRPVSFDTEPAPDEQRRIDAHVPAPCLMCGRALVSMFPDSGEAPLEPKDAVSFTGSAGYGSRFDDYPPDGFLAVNVCDDCLEQHSDRVRHAHATIQHRDVTLEPWDVAGYG